MIMQTRNALKTDYWDKDYQDQGMIEAGSDLIKKNITPKTENIDNLIPASVIAKQKLEKELKEKRRKEHFFHGKIKFDMKLDKKVN